MTALRDRSDLSKRFFTLPFEEFIVFVSVRSKRESISNVIAVTSSTKSGVGERLVVQPVDVFKPESAVIAALGIDEQGDERRRKCNPGDLRSVSAGVDRDRFRQRHGNKIDVE